jgi:N-acetylneuraminic acid mutarotase
MSGPDDDIMKNIKEEIKTINHDEKKEEINMKKLLKDLLNKNTLDTFLKKQIITFQKA